MRKLIVSNMASIDGYYEGHGRSLGALFEHRHPDYAADDRFDEYNLERLRAADLLLLSGHASFKGFRDYWWNRENMEDATPVRREIARAMNPMRKLVVSDTIRPEELAPWDNADIVRLSRAPGAIEVLKRLPGKDMLIFAGRAMWNDLIGRGLIDELHLAFFPLIGFEGTKLFDRQASISLKLLEVRSWQGSGIVVVRYQVCPPG